MQTASALTVGVVQPVRLRTPAGGLVALGRSYRGGTYLPESARPVLEAVAARVAQVALAAVVEIGIGGFAYQVRPVAIDPSVGSDAFHLGDPGLGRSYFVHRDHSEEVLCDCPDFTFRRAGTGKPCKHGRRLVELGLIPSTTSRVLPPVASRSMESRPGMAPTPARRRRFEPTPAEQAEAALMFA